MSDSFDPKKFFLPNPADLFKGKPLERLDPTRSAASPFASDKKKASAPETIGARPRHRITHITQDASNRQTLG